MAEINVLLIDDQPEMVEPLSALMSQSGYQLSYAPGGQEGLKVLEDCSPELVLLDVSMPGMNGWDTCKRIREISQVPIIMLSARVDETAILHGFNLGVDDYLTKPFSYAILQARIKAVLSRAKFRDPDQQVIVSDDLAINFERKHVTVDGTEVELTPTEYRLLEVLGKHPHRTIPISTLLNEVWGPYYQGEPQHVKQFIWLLRKKIEADPDQPKHLTSRRGFGYRFD